MGPVSGRDMVILSGVRESADGTVAMLAFSIERDDAPATRSHVRALLHPSGHIIKPVSTDPPVCEVWNGARLTALFCCLLLLRWRAMPV